MARFVPTKEDMAAEVEAEAKYFDGFPEADEAPRDCFVAGFYRGCAYAFDKSELKLAHLLSIYFEDTPANIATLLQKAGLKVTVAQVALWRKEAKP